MSWYWQTSLALSVSSFIFFLLKRVKFFREREKLSLAYFLLTSSVAFPWIPRFELKSTALQLDIAPMAAVPVREALHTVRELGTIAVQDSNVASLSIFSLSAQLFLASAILFVMIHFILLRIRTARLPVLRRSGRLSIKVEHSGSPYSAHPLNSAVVAVPENFLRSREEYRSILVHEFRHLRNFDTLWIYAIQFLRIAFLWNPLVQVLTRSIIEQQEFACDEALLGQGISAHAYGRCLFEVASQLNGSQNRLAGTTSLFLGGNKNLLRRRIEMLFRYKRKNYNRNAFILVAGGIFASFAICGGLFGSITGNRSLDLTEAKQMVEATSAHLGIPLELTPQLYQKLNDFVGTENGRDYFRRALTHMKESEAYISEQIKQRKLPLGLLAIPIMESGYQNLSGPIGNGEFSKSKAPSKGFNLESESLAPGYRGAGIWMFIPETARTYGLTVTKEKDERMDLQKSTVAALQFLSDLKAEFGSWPLAIAAYNHGPRVVKDRIQKLKTQNAWQLAEKSGGINQYLIGVAASMVILDNPKLVE